MNTISASTISSGRSAQLATALAPNDFIGKSRRAPVEWLPAPRRALRVRSNADKAGRKSYIALPVSSVVEVLFMGLLAAVAILEIAHGLSSMLNLVQNWAQYHAGVERLLQ